MSEKEDKNRLWRSFYQAERRVFDFLQEHCNCLFSIDGHDPVYQEYTNQNGVQFEKAPRFIHWIGQLLNATENEYWQLTNEMRELYKKATGDGFKHYPVRFPEFFRNVEQINISSTEAYESKIVEGNSFVLKAMKIPDFSHEQIAYELLNSDMKKLSDIGFPWTQIIKTSKLTPFDGVQPFLELVVKTDLLFNYAGTNRIQKRRITGVGYRALVRYKGNSSGCRTKLGLMLIDQYSEVSIVWANKQAPRQHALAIVGDQLQLPIDLNFQLFKK